MKWLYRWWLSNVAGINVRQVYGDVKLTYSKDKRHGRIR